MDNSTKGADKCHYMIEAINFFKKPAIQHCLGLKQINFEHKGDTQKNSKPNRIFILFVPFITQTSG